MRDFTQTPDHPVNSLHPPIMPCYQDWDYKHEYEYKDNGNHDNSRYEYQYDSYSNHNEPNQYEPNHVKSAYCNSDPTSSEPDHHHHKYNNYGFIHEVPKYEVAREEYEHRELYRDEGVYKNEETGYESKRVAYVEHEELVHDTLEPPRPEFELEFENDKVHKLTEPEYHNAGLDNGVYEPHKPQELEYDSNEVCELEELERVGNEEGYDLQGPNFSLHGIHKLDHELRHMGRNSGIHAPHTPFIGKHDSDNNAYRFAHASDNTVKPCSNHPTNAYNSTLPAPLLNSLNHEPQPYTHPHY